MSNNNPSNPVPATTGTEATAQTGSAATPKTPTGSSDFNASTPISSLADLQNKAPKLYNAMMQGIAMNIVIENQHQQDEFKQKWDEMLHDLDQ